MQQKSPEAIAFDKADEAASIEEIRKAIVQIEALIDAPPDDQPLDDKKFERLEQRKVRLTERLAEAEKKHAEDGA